MSDLSAALLLGSHAVSPVSCNPGNTASTYAHSPKVVHLFLLVVRVFTILKISLLCLINFKYVGGFWEKDETTRMLTKVSFIGIKGQVLR